MNYKAVLSPDFSMYLEMAPIVQLYNTFRNRWCGAYWASKGLTVIPSVNWGDKSTFDFCFDGIEHGNVVAVSTYMASAHDNRQDQKEWFMSGYNELLRRIEPEYIICYNTPFPEMEGNIIPVDYDLSSWRYMQPQKSVSEDLSAYQIGGQAQIFCDTMDVYKVGTVIKGGGSAYGGQWRPNPEKPQDLVFKGTPNSIAKHFIPTKQGGYWVVAKYDSNGNATLIRHETGHATGSGHSNPHDHVYSWNNPTMHPQKGETINYPNGAPEFKLYAINTEEVHMSTFEWTEELYRFHTISEFKTSMRYGAEVVIEWQGQEYGIWSEDNIIRITRSSSPEENHIFSSADESLEFMVGDDRLRDVITKVTVLDRTL